MSPTPSSPAPADAVSVPADAVSLPAPASAYVVASLGGVTPYERRVRLAADAVAAHSDLSAERAREVAVHVLDAVDRIPERIR